MAQPGKKLNVKTSSRCSVWMVRISAAMPDFRGTKQQSIVHVKCARFICFHSKLRIFEICTKMNPFSVHIRKIFENNFYVPFPDSIGLHCCLSQNQSHTLKNWQVSASPF